MTQLTPEQAQAQFDAAYEDYLKRNPEIYKTIYVAFYDYGHEGKSPPFYVGESLEELIKADPNYGSTRVIQKWQNGKYIGDLK